MNKNEPYLYFLLSVFRLRIGPKFEIILGSWPWTCVIN